MAKMASGNKAVWPRIKTGIAFRMFILLILFICLIFTAVFASFNYFMNYYISRDMTNQLRNARLDIEVRFHADIMRQLPQFVSHFELREHGVRRVMRVDYHRISTMITRYIRETNSKSEVNLVLYRAGEYERLFPTDMYEALNVPDIDDMDNIISIVRANGLTGEDDIVRVSNPHGSYYLTNVNLGALFGEVFDNVFVALYISTEKYDELIASIYNMLLIILIAAAAFTFVYAIFISRSISKPIQKLCGFADDIGRGNFKRNEYEFRDKELVDLNRRMNETARKLEINDEDQKIFFQNVSHELKTPLMSIKGYAEGIKYGIFSSESEKNNASGIIIEESERLNDLVADLLYISKMDLKQPKTDNFTAASLGGLLEDCADRLRGVLINSQDKKNIIINHSRRDIYIKCDEESLFRAVMNITANCLRYAQTAVCIEYYESGDSVVLKIKDDGAGIDSSDLPNVFKRFYKGKGGKHGIGLSIAKAVIERHGAQIQAANRTDCSGAEFTVIFDKGDE